MGLCPAVKDATTEQAEAKSTALKRLLARRVHSQITLDKSIDEIRQQAIQEYQELLDSNANALLIKFDGIVVHIADPLDAGLGVLGPDTQFFERLAQCEDDAIAGSFSSAERATNADGLAGDEPGKTAAVDLLKLVEHPEHVLRVGHHIRRRYIAHRTDLPRHLAHPATAT